MDEYDNYVNYIDGLRRHQISSVEPLWEISEQYENIYKTYITRSIGAVLEARGLLRHFIGISTLSQCGKIIFKHHNKFLTFVKQKKIFDILSVFNYNLYGIIHLDNNTTTSSVH